MKLLLSLFIVCCSSTLNAQLHLSHWRFTPDNSIEIKHNRGNELTLTYSTDNERIRILKCQFLRNGDTVVIRHQTKAPSVIAMQNATRAEYPNGGLLLKQFWPNTQRVDKRSDIHVSFDGTSDVIYQNGDIIPFEKIQDNKVLINGNWVSEITNFSVIHLESTKSTWQNSDYLTLLPSSFDALTLVKSGDDWNPVVTAELENHDLSIFEGLKEVSWHQYKNEIYVKNTDPQVVPKEYIHTYNIDTVHSEVLDLSAFTSLRKLYIQHGPEKVKIIAPQLVDLGYSAGTNKPVSIQLANQTKIDKMYTAAPIRSTNITKIGDYHTIPLPNQSINLNFDWINVSELTIRLNGAESFRLSDRISGVKKLRIFRGSNPDGSSAPPVVNFSWSAQLRNSLRNLEFVYCDAADYTFLKTPNKLEILQAQFKDRGQFQVAHGLAKDKFTVYSNQCFTSNSIVTVEGKGEVSIDEVRIGDKVATLVSGELHYTQVVKIDWHFNQTVDLVKMTYAPLIVHATQGYFATASVRFTKNHPLWINGPVLIDALSSSSNISTLNGSINRQDIEISSEVYNGNLINIETEAGHFLVNGFLFSNK